MPVLRPVCRTPLQRVKLYNLKHGEYFRPLDSQNQPDSPALQFDHLDGMYSFNRDKAGEVWHIAAFADVEKVLGWNEAP